jgi:phospholipase/carboxylesterase
LLSLAATPAVRLFSRPKKPRTPAAAGLHPLGIHTERDALLYIPETVPADQPAPLMMYLHGATGAPQQGIKRLSAYADEFGFLLLSPGSDGVSWDAIRGRFGADVRTIDEALRRTFARRAVEARRVGVSGFSDGATYALGLGLSNGDLFRSVIAFSPGFLPAEADPLLQPRVFISHGTADRILPIDTCSRALAPRLKRAGYDVTYREFDGPHTMPPDIVREAMVWFKA